VAVDVGLHAKTTKSLAVDPNTLPANPLAFALEMAEPVPNASYVLVKSDAMGSVTLISVNADPDVAAAVV
jgi:hypothetical protein